jgi:hypothetical protein
MMSIIARAYAAFVVGFIGWATFLATRDHTAFPTSDDVRLLVGLTNEPFWQWVFSIQNGHRVPGTLLLFAADYHWFDARNDLMLVASLVTFMLALFVLLQLARSGGGLRTPSAQIGFAAACFSLFWVASCFNLLFGVTHANAAVLLFGFASIGWLVRYSLEWRTTGRASGRWIALSLGAGVLATVSMGQGIAIWPTLAVLAVVLRLPLAALGVVVATAVLVGGASALSTAGFTSQFTNTPPSEILVVHPLKLLRFAATFIGAVPGHVVRWLGWTTEWQGQQNGVAGVVGFVLLAAHAAWLRRHPGRAGPLDGLAIGLMTLAAAIGAGVGATRLFTFGFGQAFAIRFVDWSGLFWAGAVLSLAAVAVRSQHRSAFAWTTAVVFVWTALLLGSFDRVRHEGRVTQSRDTDASISVLVGSAGPWEFKKFHAGPAEDLSDLLEVLEREEKSLYTDERRHWIGQRLQNVLTVDEDYACAGQIVPRAPDDLDPQNQWRILGWGWDLERDAPPRSVVLVDQRGVIRGFSQMLPRRPSAEEGRGTWKGWVKFTRRRNQYTAYAIVDEDLTACRIAEGTEEAVPKPRRRSAKPPTR